MSIREELNEIDEEEEKKERKQREMQMNDDELRYLRNDILVLKRKVDRIVEFIETRLK